MNAAWHNRSVSTDKFAALNRVLQGAGLDSETLKVAKWSSIRTIFDPHFDASRGQDEPNGRFEFLHYFPTDKRLRKKLLQVSNGQPRVLSDLPFGKTFLRVRRQLN